MYEFLVFINRYPPTLAVIIKCTLYYEAMGEKYVTCNVPE